MRTLVWVCLLMLMASVAQAQNGPAASDGNWTRNWPQWRGPMATGVAPQGNPPTAWDENTNIKWKVPVAGHSTATPIVWGDQIFLTTAIETDRPGKPEVVEPPTEDKTTPDGKARPRALRFGNYGAKTPDHYWQFVVMCLDRKSGKILWQHTAKETVPHEGHHPDGSFAAASPMTDGRRLFVSFGSRGIYCYELDGKPVWGRDLGRMTIINVFGEGTSPVIKGDALVVNWDHQDGSFITCLDANTGETRWKVERDENSTWATPLVVDHAGRTQVIVHGSTRVRSYDLKTGDLIWACGGQGPSAIPTPVTDGKAVYAMTGFITNALYAIPLDAQGDITGAEDKIVWKNRKIGTPYVPSPLLYDNLLYFTAGNKGILTCVNATTGEFLIDKQRLEGIANIYASPVGASGHIYLTSREGTTVVIKHNQFEKEGDKNRAVIVATNKLDDAFDASAAVVGQEIFLRGLKNLYCIGSQ